MLRCAVEGTSWQSSKASNGTDLQKSTSSTWRVRLAEELDGLASNPRCAPEVCVDDNLGFLLGHALELSDIREPGIVHDDIDPTEHRLGLSKGIDNLLGLRDVETDRKEPVLGILGYEVIKK